MDLHLRGKRFIVTGGASGIGRAVSLLLAQEGAVPVIFDRNPLPDELYVELCIHLPEVHSHQIDLTDEGKCAAAVAETCSALGGIDGLVNNAGVNDNVGLEAGKAAFLRSLEVNLIQAYVMTSLCVPEIRKSKGAIVNISSKTALTGQGRTSGYVAAKAGLLGLTREWAAALAADQVRVNAVLPAEVLTPLYQKWLQSAPYPERALAEIQARIPLGQRLTKDTEIADMVVFLLSDRASHMTGQWLHPDGGYVHLDRALP